MSYLEKQARLANEILRQITDSELLARLRNGVTSDVEGDVCRYCYARSVCLLVILGRREDCLVGPL